MAHYEAHYIVIKRSRLGWSAYLKNQSGQVLNAINGDPHDSRARVLAAAQKHWPEALYARQRRDTGRGSRRDTYPAKRGSYGGMCLCPCKAGELAPMATFDPEDPYYSGDRTRGRRSRMCLKEHARYMTTCGGCGRSWCDRCDPAHGPLCHWCHGRGYSTAPGKRHRVSGSRTRHRPAKKRRATRGRRRR